MIAFEIHVSTDKSPCIAEIESCGFKVGQEEILSVADLVMKYILMIAG
jgi:hypothetical protein